MRRAAGEKTPVILPVRRRLTAAAVAYLLGIFLAAQKTWPVKGLIVLCVLFSACALLRLRRRKDALFCVLALMLLAGSLRAGRLLRVRDTPTRPGASIAGTVCGVVKQNRVYLTDVTVDGRETTARDVVVTLMAEEGGHAGAPLVGQRVRGTGRLFAPDEPRNPGGMNGRIRALCRGYELSGYLLPGWTARGEAVFSPGEALRLLREGILTRIDGLFGPQAALFRGILLGDRSELGGEVTQAMRLTGTAHILTVSGLHLSLIARAVGMLLRRAPLRRRSRFAVMAAFLMFFTGLTGAAAGTVRACIMAILREYAVVRGRRYEPLTGLACAALLMLLYRPLWAFDASFQFSFCVVLGIQLFARGLAEAARRRMRANRWLRAAAETALFSLVAQIAAMPMQLLLYGYVPVLSLPMNVLCSALMPTLLLGGWGAVLLGVVWPNAGAIPAGLLARLAAGFEALSLRAAQMDGAIVRLPAPYAVSVLLCVALMLLCTRLIRLGRWRKQAAVAVACLLAALYLPRLNPQPRYVQLDVGQGDAALFRRGRRAVLVDVGPADSYDMLWYLRSEGLHVDAVILSHLDQDHAGALPVLLDSEVDIPAVAVDPRAAEGERDTQAARSLLAHAVQAGVRMLPAVRGERLSAGGMTLEVLAPDEGAAGSNARSLLLSADVEGVSFLLTGDLPMENEPADVPACDVLKVAHHGSRYATSDAFLDGARPGLAIISVGANNRYGHPGARVLDALARIGADVLRTDESGCVTLWLKDGGYRVQTHMDSRGGIGPPAGAYTVTSWQEASRDEEKGKQGSGGADTGASRAD